ncbi:MAG: glycoside hydrolase family 36 protein [Candidatus Dormibacteraceae bacterium]
MSAGRLIALEGGRLRIAWPGDRGPALECPRVTVHVRLAGGGLHSSASWRPLPGFTAARGRLQTSLGPLQLTLDLAAAGEVVRLRPSATATGPVPVDVQEIGLSFEPVAAGETIEWIVYNGYQSWDPAGYRPLPVPQAAGAESWWTCGLGTASGAGLAAAALSARHALTRFRYGGAGSSRLEISQLAAPAIGREAALWHAVRRGSAWHGEEIALTATAAVTGGLATLAGFAAGVREPAGVHRAVPRGWLSWYHFGPWVSPENILDNARELTEGHLAGCDYKVVQIDDGWQEAWGDWVPNARFGPGLEDLAGRLREKGLVPGIWVAPFLVGETSMLAGEAPDSWFIRDRETGRRALDPRERPARSFQVLDLRRAEVRQHLTATFARLRQAGFGYFKIDFVYAGAYSGIPGLRAGLRAIRRGVEESYLLACGAPLLPVLGLVDGCRIGQDTATPIFDFETGNPRAGFVGDEIRSVARNVAGRHFLRRWFQLDADVALVSGGASEDEARQLLTAVVLSGGPFLAADDLARLAPERRAMLTNPAVLDLIGGPPAVPDWQSDRPDRPPRIWRRPDGVIGIFNWEWEGALVEVPLPVRAGEPALAVTARELWSGRELRVEIGGGGRGSAGGGGRIIAVDLPPRGAGLIALAPR